MRFKAWRAYSFILLIFFSCQEGKFTVTARVADTEISTTYATFNGWTQIKAVGAKTPAAQASDLVSSAASVTLSWNDMVSTAGTVATYNIYRSAT